MIESPERFPLGLREALPGIEQEKKDILLRGLTNDLQRKYLINDLHRLVRGYTLPLRLEELAENSVDEMIIHRAEHSEMILRVLTLPAQDRASALRFLLGLEPDARATHFTEN